MYNIPKYITVVCWSFFHTCGYIFSLFAFTESLAVRLVNSNDECSGRVEVRHDDQWHTVCDTDWTLSKAGAVCESLQCGRAVKAHGGAVFGRGSGSVVEASNSCFGNVTSLQQCSVEGFTRATCGHEYDAGVLCAGKSLLLCSKFKHNFLRDHKQYKLLL